MNPFCFCETQYLHFTTRVFGHSAISPFLGGFKINLCKRSKKQWDRKFAAVKLPRCLVCRGVKMEWGRLSNFDFFLQERANSRVFKQKWELDSPWARDQAYVHEANVQRAREWSTSTYRRQGFAASSVTCLLAATSDRGGVHGAGANSVWG